MRVDASGRPEASNQPEGDPLLGLTHPRAEPPERVPIRVRGRGTNLAGWRMSIVAEEGTGAIVLAEVSSAERHHRGEGIFLGWSPERLAAAYAALLPADDESTDVGLQLG